MSKSLFEQYYGDSQETISNFSMLQHFSKKQWELIQKFEDRRNIIKEQKELMDFAQEINMPADMIIQEQEKSIEKLSAVASYYFVIASVLNNYLEKFVAPKELEKSHLKLVVNNNKK